MKKRFKSFLVIGLLVLSSCGSKESTSNSSSSKVEQVTIRFYDGRSEEPFKTFNIDKGSSFTQRVIPPYYSDKQYVYNFSSWDKSLENINQDTDYYPEYVTSLVNYHVSFYSDDMISTYYENDIHYKDEILYQGEIPTKKTTERLYAYTFTGWSVRNSDSSWSEPYLDDITFDWDNAANTSIVLKANFSLDRVAYEATFKNGDTILKQYELGLDEILIYDGETPTKEGPEGIYTFTGWDQVIPTVPLTEDMVFNAEFSLEKYKYNVDYYDEDKTTLLEHKVIEYGDYPAKGGAPSASKESESIEYRYAFDGWKDIDGKAINIFAKVTSDLNLYASYNKVDIIWTVIFNANGGYWLTSTSKLATKTFDDVVNGHKITLIDAPNHYDNGIKMNFIGYALSKNYQSGDTLYQPGELMIISDNVTLYAVWEKSNPPMPNLGVEYESYGVESDYTYEAKKTQYSAYEDYAIKSSMGTVRDKDGHYHSMVVNKISDSAWKNDTKVKRIYLPSSIREIGKEAFWGCKNLEYIELNEGLLTIHDNIFIYTDSLKGVVIPSSVTLVYDNLNSYSNRIMYFKATSKEELPYVKRSSTLLPDIRFDEKYSSEVSRGGYALYSETAPTVSDGFNYWHYVDGVPTIWE